MKEGNESAERQETGNEGYENTEMVHQGIDSVNETMKTASDSGILSDAGEQFMAISGHVLHFVSAIKMGFDIYSAVGARRQAQNLDDIAATIPANTPEDKALIEAVKDAAKQKYEKAFNRAVKASITAISLIGAGLLLAGLGSTLRMGDPLPPRRGGPDLRHRQSRDQVRSLAQAVVEG